MFTRGALALLPLLLIAAGCSSGEQVAEPSPSNLDGPAPACTTETVLDEYGFSTVVQICDGEVVDTPVLELEISLPNAEVLQGSQIARTVLRGIRDRLVLQTGCVGPSAVPGEIDLAHPSDVRAALERIPDDRVAELVRDVFAAVTTFDETCRAAPEGVEADIAPLASAVEELAVALGAPPLEGNPHHTQTAAATMAYDRLFALLSSAGNVHASDLWFSSTHLAHAAGLEELRRSGPAPTTLLLGSSVMARAADVGTINELAGDETVVSLALAGATRPVHVALANDAIGQFSEITSIVWGQSTNALFDQSCDTSDAPLIDNVLRLQRAAFAGTHAERTPTERLLGPSGEYGQTPIWQSAMALHGTWDRGEMIAFDGRDEGRRDDQRPGLIARYRQPATCDVYFDTIANALAEWTDRGLDVVLIATPIPDELAGLHPGGRAGHAEVVARLATLATDAGAIFIDLSDSVDDDDFFDFTHVNAAGRAVFSEALGEALATR